MKKPLVILRASLDARLLSKLAQHCEVIDVTSQSNWEQTVVDNYPNAQALLTNGHDGASAFIISSLVHLKLIACNGVGYDAVDVSTAKDHGVVVTHTRNVLNEDVANTTIMLILAVSRKLVRDVNWIKEGKWVSNGPAPLTDTVQGKHFGLVGMGRIGQAIAKKLRIFDGLISYHSRTPKKQLDYQYYDSLTELAKQVDYLIVITVGDASTHKLINEDVIHALGKKGTLINMARGSVVDQNALVHALLNNKLGGAALDVFEDEPNTPKALNTLDNVIMLPHIGSATIETRYAMGELTVNNILQFFDQGKAMTPVPECDDI